VSFLALLSFRLAKEVSYYQKEVEDNEFKLEHMKTEGRDPYDIKKLQEVLGESKMMVPDSQARFQGSLEELAILVDDFEAESEWLTPAKALLEEHKVRGKARVEETNVGELREGEAF
jgi:tubulin-specific chaperone A